MSCESRIKSTLALIDGKVEGLIYRPRMHLGSDSFHEADNALKILLSVRAELVGGSYSLKKYLHGAYPDIPGPVRSISQYVWRIGRGGVDYVQRHKDWTAESEKFVRWAISEMSK